jgi:hypothetical protein
MELLIRHFHVPKDFDGVWPPLRTVESDTPNLSHVSILIRPSQTMAAERALVAAGRPLRTYNM